jgi:hypothetical protein
MLTAGIFTSTVAREFAVNFSTISCFQRCFREFGSTSNPPHNHRPRVWHCVGEWFADVNVVNRVPHGSGVVMVWEGINYGRQTGLHFFNGILNAQRYLDEILRLIVVPFIYHCHPMFQRDNARPHVTRICTQFPGS